MLTYHVPLFRKDMMETMIPCEDPNLVMFRLTLLMFSDRYKL